FPTSLRSEREGANREVGTRSTASDEDVLRAPLSRFIRREADAIGARPSGAFRPQGRDKARGVGSFHSFAPAEQRCGVNAAPQPCKNRDTSASREDLWDAVERRWNASLPWARRAAMTRHFAASLTS